MGAETWWHGRILWAARMGEAPGFYDIGRTMAKPIRSARYMRRTHMPGPTTLRSSLPTTWFRGTQWVSNISLLQMLLLTTLLHVRSSTAVFVPFSNCLSPEIVSSDNPKRLQFVPLYVWATFNSSAPSHNINVTAYGNVAGIATQEPYPPPNDPQWRDPNATVGKIPDVAGPAKHQKYTTFTTRFDVLDYTPYNPPPVRFCNSSALTQCPLTPVFDFKGNE